MKSLPKQVGEFLQGLSSEERTVFKSVLSARIPSFFDEENRLALPDKAKEAEFHSLAEMLRSIPEYSASIPLNGVAYRGRPRWVAPRLLGRLQREALARRHQPLDRVDHYLGCGGAEADKLSVSPEVVSFVERHVGPVVPTGIASYLYYDRPGLGIRPHVDTDVFSVNLMLMVRHDCPKGVTPSSTTVFPARRKPESFWLGCGEVMIMYGGSVIHARSLVQAGEKIHLLTIGFNLK